MERVINLSNQHFAQVDKPYLTSQLPQNISLSTAKQRDNQQSSKMGL